MVERRRDERHDLRIGRRKVAVSNLDKPMFPETGFTKGEILDYYVNVSPVLLPYLRNRPLTQKRYPDGVGGAHFYEKDAPSHAPEWVKTFPVERKRDGRIVDYLLLNDLPSLVWSVNLANLEMHALLAKAPRIERPTWMVFDLDPGEPATVIECGTVAFLLKSVLDSLELESFVKASGSKGLQLYVPLNTAVSYDDTKPFARAVARHLERELPGLIVSKMAKSLRKGKVLIDWSQNDDFKTTVVVYSLRAKGEIPYVSMPFEWGELARVLERRDPDKLYYEPGEALKRIDRKGDLFEPLSKIRQKLPPSEAIAGAVRDVSKLARDRPFARPAAGASRGGREPGGKSLSAYRAKRDFTRTDEPEPERIGRKRSGDLSFVVQKHAASHLHYDFRLEMEGVLRSWAVPKGIPTGKGVRRLAVHVEDHPLDYGGFEGTIPPGNYGAGTVMLWDRGSYTEKSGDPEEAFASGKLEIELSGEKLRGSWVLVRTGRAEEWLLIKSGSGVKGVSKKSDDTSVLTGRSMIEISRDGRQWRPKAKRRRGAAGRESVSR